MDPDKKRHCFQKVFGSDEGILVLQSLVEFARADEAEYCQDPRKDAYMQGRRSVVLEIKNTIKEKNNE